MTDQIKPVAVLDVSDPAMGNAASLDARLKWLRAQGIDPSGTKRVEVFQDDVGLFAMVYRFQRNGNDMTFVAFRASLAEAPPVQAAAAIGKRRLHLDWRRQ